MCVCVYVVCESVNVLFASACFFFFLIVFLDLSRIHSLSICLSVFRCMHAHSHVHLNPALHSLAYTQRNTHKRINTCTHTYVHIKCTASEGGRVQERHQDRQNAPAGRYTAQSGSGIQRIRATGEERSETRGEHTPTPVSAGTGWYRCGHWPQLGGGFRSSHRSGDCCRDRLSIRHRTQQVRSVGRLVVCE
jgi:hypothetical protein